MSIGGVPAPRCEGKLLHSEVPSYDLPWQLSWDSAIYDECTATSENPLGETKVYLDDFQADGLEKSRIDAQEKALQLARTLEHPRDAVLNFSFSVCDTWVLR